jgi:rhodanese-related sulfurtransferase
VANRHADVTTSVAEGLLLSGPALHCLSEDESEERMRSLSVVLLLALVVIAGCATTRPSPEPATSPVASGAPPAPEANPSVYAAVLAETDAPTPNISTAELTDILARGNAVVLDTRPRREWAVSHIPSALNVAPKPGVPMSQYVSDVAEIERLVGGDKTRPLVLYCNGPFCGKSKRLSEELLSAGFTSVRRYQLGVPVWRALGGMMVTEAEGARYVFENDRTSVWIDAREAGEFATGSLSGARSIPWNKVLPGKDVGEVKAAKDDGRLPMEDHNTRIVVFGRDSEQARAVAEAIAREAFHNVSFFPGSYAELVEAVRP